MTEIAMNNQFELLDCDDDVVLLDKETFKIGRFKELVNEAIRSKWRTHIYDGQIQERRGQEITKFFSEVSISGVKISLNETQHTTIINCELLKIASAKGWQKGKLRIQICISPLNYQALAKVYVEFSSDEPNEPESPLDDIRKMINSSEIKSS